MNNSDTGEACSSSSGADCDPEPAAASFEVSLANEQHLLTIDERLLVDAVQLVLSESSYASASVSIAVVDDPTIHQLNQQFLAHDYPTDVLSFVLEATETHVDGELIVSTDTATRQAAQAGWSPHDELLLYVLHGTLHLVGFRDKTPAEHRRMVEAEADYLTRLGTELPVDRSRWFLPEETPPSASNLSNPTQEEPRP